MFKKKPKENTLTQKNGTTMPQGLGKSNFAVYVSLPKIKGSPTAELAGTLSIGREVGDLIIPDSGLVSPRHCTFTLNQDVISVMDHSSASGTFINKKRLEPGRVYILQDSDKFFWGNCS